MQQVFHGLSHVHKMGKSPGVAEKSNMHMTKQIVCVRACVQAYACTYT